MYLTIYLTDDNILQHSLASRRLALNLLAFVNSKLVISMMDLTTPNILSGQSLVVCTQHNAEIALPNTIPRLCRRQVIVLRPRLRK